MSLVGWIVYSKTPYNSFVSFLILGGISGFGCQLTRIVKVEKLFQMISSNQTSEESSSKIRFISSQMIYYAYLSQPIIATIVGYYFVGKYHIVSNTS